MNKKQREELTNKCIQYDILTELKKMLYTQKEWVASGVFVKRLPFIGEFCGMTAEVETAILSIIETRMDNVESKILALM